MTDAIEKDMRIQAHIAILKRQRNYAILTAMGCLVLMFVTLWIGAWVGVAVEEKAYDLATFVTTVLLMAVFGLGIAAGVANAVHCINQINIKVGEL